MVLLFISRLQPTRMAGLRSFSSRRSEAHNMKCQACGNPQMVAKIQDETLVYGGQSLTLHSMRGDFCPACGEGMWDEESYRRYTEAQAAIIRAVKGDVSADIRRIRKGLKLTQTELSEVVGIGKVAFSRYERGETKPPAPL